MLQFVNFVVSLESKATCWENFSNLREVEPTIDIDRKFDASNTVMNVTHWQAVRTTFSKLVHSSIQQCLEKMTIYKAHWEVTIRNQINLLCSLQ